MAFEMAQISHIGSKARRNPWGSLGCVIRKLYHRATGRMRWFAWTDDLKTIIGVYDTRREAREARRAAKEGAGG